MYTSLKMIYENEKFFYFEHKFVEPLSKKTLDFWLN